MGTGTSPGHAVSSDNQTSRDGHRYLIWERLPPLIIEYNVMGIGIPPGQDPRC